VEFIGFLLVVLVLIGGSVVLILLFAEPASSPPRDPVEEILSTWVKARIKIRQASDDYLRQVQVLLNEQARTAQFSCLNPDCPDYSVLQSERYQRNLRKYGKTPIGHQRYQCKTCGKTFSDTRR